MRPLAPALTVAAFAMIATVAVAVPATTPSTRPAASRPTTTTTASAVSHDPRAVCQGHLRQLYMAAELVANETKGSLLPTDLRAIFAELADDGVLEPAMAICPVDRTVKAPKNWAAMSKDDRITWAVAHTSYTWSGGGLDANKAMAAGVGDQLIVLSERPRDHINHGGGMNVGFADGTVFFVPNADLPAVTARSDAARAKLK